MRHLWRLHSFIRMGWKVNRHVILVQPGNFKFGWIILSSSTETRSCIPRQCQIKIFFLAHQLWFWLLQNVLQFHFHGSATGLSGMDGTCQVRINGRPFLRIFSCPRKRLRKHSRKRSRKQRILLAPFLSKSPFNTSSCSTKAQLRLSRASSN